MKKLCHKFLVDKKIKTRENFDFQFDNASILLLTFKYNIVKILYVNCPRVYYILSSLEKKYKNSQCSK